MTEYVIATIIGVIQSILSINLIVRKKNGWATASEIISSFALLFVLSVHPLNAQNNYWMQISVTLVEYISVKVFLVIFMLTARYYSFYRIRALCSKKKKVDSKKFKFIRVINKCSYWPRLKLGIPYLANKTNTKTKVKFDSKGFPKFKAYYTIKLRRKYFKCTRERHFYMANKILYEDVCSNSRLKAKFSKRQLEELAKNETPKGYTWHHHQDAGTLQLVDEEIHAKTYHYGGYSIWGGK